MRAVLVATAVFIATAAPAPAQARYILPDNPQKTSEALASISKSTADGVHFSGDGAEGLWNSLYADCSVFGIDDRYVYFDTLFRESLIEARAYGDKKTYLAVTATPTGLVVDSISPPNAVHADPLKVRMAVIDQSGRFLYSTFSERGIKGACEGEFGYIFLKGNALMSTSGRGH